MKKIDNVKYLVLSLVFLPVFASAQTAQHPPVVQVDNYVANIQGIGDRTVNDFSSVILYKNNTLKQSKGGYSAAYSLEDAGSDSVDYEVKGILVPNYEYTLAGDCKGTIQENKIKMCSIQWTDTGPAEVPQQVLEPAPVQELPLLAPQISAPVVISSEDTIEQQELIKSLLLQVIELLKQLIALKLQSQ
jgi:hypothetical protein